MRKSTKGALAAATAALLLVGGASSLAYWSDSGTAPGISVTAGQLDLSTPDCGSGWVFDGGEATADAPYTNQALVPGDVLTQTCTATITATGEHMRATLSVTPGATAGDLFDPTTGEATFTSAATRNGAALPAEITDANVGAGALSVSMTVTFDGPEATNASMLDAGSVTSFAIALEQVHS